MNKAIHYLYNICVCAVLGCVCSCNDSDTYLVPETLGRDVINIGGVETEDMDVSTRAAGVDAETIDWLVQPLTQGLDITYGLYDAEESHEDVAILKLTDKTTNPATYTFTYRANRKDKVGPENLAIWYNNGPHYFQGVHVPERIRYTSDNIADIETSTKAPGLTTDQHNATSSGSDAELGNYTLLSHYLGMPANYRLTATVERIKLPFRHRLARVVAFVLIDPDLHTTLKGYEKKDASGNVLKDENGQPVIEEDPTNISIRFCNVKVLQGVKDVVESGGHHVLTPQWKKERKVIPHFEGEKGSYNYKNNTSGDSDFKMYISSDKKKEIYPSSTDWKTTYDATDHNGCTEVNYGKVPVYDIIVRPTYTSTDNVMYDEEGYANETDRRTLANNTNSIDFEIELENGLRYEKTFDFDLDANYQTVVYLRISREQVDYDAAGSDLWIESKNNDDYYGVDNENGNTLSKAGSSWQRAYRSKSLTGDKVTDGDFYNKTDESIGQYIGDNNKWIELLLQASEGGAHHGDYFILDNDITIDATQIPANFVFTGHLDAQDHVITIDENSVGKDVYKEAENITEKLYTKSEGVYSEWNIPTLRVKLVTPITYTDEDLEIVDGFSYVKSTLKHVAEEEIKYETQEECDNENLKQEHHPLTEDETGKKPGEDGYTPTYDMEHYIDGYSPVYVGDVKEVIPEHYEVIDDTSVIATTSDVKRYDTTYPIATAETDPAYPTTLEQLKSGSYYIDETETSFVCPELFQFSHVSLSYLFTGLKGDYVTTQENAQNPYAVGVIWQANVHKETNKSTVWVPTLGYRAEILNAVIKGGSLFPDNPVEGTITGNVQNCYVYKKDEQGNDKKVSVTYTPTIPQYK